MTPRNDPSHLEDTDLWCCYLMNDLEIPDQGSSGGVTWAGWARLCGLVTISAVLQRIAMGQLTALPAMPRMDFTAAAHDLR